MALVVITIQDTGEDEADVSARFGPEVPTTDSGEVDAQACGLVALAAIKDRGRAVAPHAEASVER